MSITDVLFSFNGRIKRTTWWVVNILLVLISYGAIYLFFGLLSYLWEPVIYYGAIGIYILFNLLAIWIYFAVGVKRLHDRDKSGWWFLISLIPIIGVIWMIVDLGLLKGTTGPNKYNPDLTMDEVVVAEQGDT